MFVLARAVKKGTDAGNADVVCDLLNLDVILSFKVDKYVELEEALSAAISAVCVFPVSSCA